MPAGSVPDRRHSRIAGPPRRLMACAALVLVLLQGCATTRGAGGATGSAAGDGGGALSFRVNVVSDDRDVASHLERHLDIQRFTGFPDLQPAELRRLLDEADANARELLAALGYFEPRLELRVGEVPADGGARRIEIEVEPGKLAQVAGVQIRFAEPMNSDPEGAPQRSAIEEGWLLKPGNRFTQEDWDAAKARGLRVLQRERYPAARLQASEATVDPAAATVELSVTYDAGRPYRFGSLSLQGVERYDAQGIHNIARLPFGAVYSEEALLDAQQRLIASGLFDAAFLMLDTAQEDPASAPVVAQLREAKYQKIVFGLGYSTDTGPRLSVDHTHNEMWPLGWRALNQLTAGTDTQALSTRWTDMPAASGWAWNTGLALERSEYGDFKANSLSLTGGRERSRERVDERYALQYDASKAEGGEAPGASSSLLGNYSWTARHFDSRTSPTRGFGLGADLGAGMTVTPRGDPFLRVHLRALQLLPFGGPNGTGRRNRVSLRAEAGAIAARSGVTIPVTLLFLTGGDTTVRGHGYHSIGNRLDDGSVYGARYMAMGSMEWQRPVKLFGDVASWEHTLFVDAGAASDQPRDAVLYTGVGTGLRWSSPVGPLQLDAAYGTKVRRWRLHLRMGFQF